ncbi:MAG TPA: alpha/beta hydrolase [Acetobacteraceae bacterium]|jgi:pimeloyl-ACP methyl ester carboxylesterase|nr:alpha/beta hydrolase [Acetobacteraceae bacterium]
MTTSLLGGIAVLAAASIAPTDTLPTPDFNRITYHSVMVDGTRAAYRAAGPADAPVILLLHGFPSSSRMFVTLIPLLADRFRLIAPDYPGFGQSDAPPPDAFAYTFDHLASVVDKLTEALGLTHYALYMQDYGGPVGFRLALAHPERVTALIVQNAVAHDEGISGPLWEPRKAYWRDPKANEAKVMANLISPEAAKLRHVGGAPYVDHYDPDLWTDEAAFLARPGQDRIQLALFYDYRTNQASYPTWQAWLRRQQPPTLILWGRYDPSFSISEVDAYKRDLPNAEAHVLDAGHFALDEAVVEVAQLIRSFGSRFITR